MKGTNGRGRRKCSPRARWVIALCWIVFTCSYIGKLGYTANIIPIETAFGISHSQAGLVSTFFFFAYGAGQIFNGLFCKKYSLRYVIPAVLVVSAGCNLALVFVPSFSPVKYLWLLNGVALSVLWPSLIRFLSENLSDSDMAQATVVMGTSTAVGTFVTYGLSTLLVALDVFYLIFVAAACLLPAIGIVWFFVYRRMLYEKIESEEESISTLPRPKEEIGRAELILLFAGMAVFAVITNLVKDGLNTWVPSILKELYDLPDFLSILLTLVLPLCAIFGTMTAVALHKKIKGLNELCIVLFALSAAAIGVVIGCLRMSIVLPLFGLAVVSCLMSGSNSVVTTIAPLLLRGKVNSGLWAGVLNGCCYLGSTVSSYGLGSLADACGWNAVFWLLFGLSVAAVIIGGGVSVVRRILVKRKSGG